AYGGGRRRRLGFGVSSVREGRTGHDLPTNLTVIFEGEARLFATRGADHCTVDELRQERVGALGGPKRTWRIIARGFCIAPASTLDSDARILLSRFDFAGSAVFEYQAAPMSQQNARRWWLPAVLLASVTELPAQEPQRPLDLTTFPRTTLEITQRGGGGEQHRYSFRIWVAD